MENICIRATVEGRVQGVSFRDGTRRQALALGVTGHARNNPDGTVDVLACGEQSAVKHLVDWLHKGPPAASVARVSTTQEQCQAPSRFTVG